MWVKMEKYKINSLPEKPGVYIFKNIGGEVIYVGKAKNLRRRVRSYFQGGRKDVKTEQLAENVKDLDFIVTKTELEAFILENTLIKEHKPKYNIMLKDDKSYPFIKIAMKEKYPGVYITRNTKDKKSIYFGPFFSGDAKRVVAMLYRVFKIRQCTLDLSGRPLKRPCIYYDTGVCSAPCVQFISEENYMKTVKAVKAFLNGNYRDLKQKLTLEMLAFSEEKNFEKAAQTRDTIKAVEEIMKEQKVVVASEKNTDVFGYLYKNEAYYFGVFNIRAGRVVSKTISVFEDMPKEAQPLSVFINQYYSRNMAVPDEVILPAGAAQESVLNEVVFKPRGIKALYVKRNGLLKLVNDNLLERETTDERIREQKGKVKKEFLIQMEALQQGLKLARLPKVIEGIDISHSSGQNMVGSLVVFNNGEPDKSNYRRYKIKTVTQVDDFAAVTEVVIRRYGKMKEQGLWFPDLILIDGGIGQVNSAKRALETLALEIPVIGLAKQNEEVFRPYKNEPVKIGIKAQFLLMRLRDEAHRFAVKFQTELSSKKLKQSVFDEIPYIGEKTRYRIYNEFKDRADLLEAVEKNEERAKFLNEKQKTAIKKILGTKHI